MKQKTQIAGIVNPGVLQDVIMLLTRSDATTGVLRIKTRTTHGEIWLEDSKPLAATFGGWSGEEAIYNLLMLDNGSFVFTARTDTPRRNIFDTLQTIIINAIQRAEVENARKKSVAIKKHLPFGLAPKSGTLAPAKAGLRQSKRHAAWIDPTKHITAITLLFILLGTEAVIITRAIRPVISESIRIQTNTEAQQEEADQLLEGQTRALLLAGNGLWHAGQYDKAMKAFEGAARATPGSPAITALLKTARHAAALNRSLAKQQPPPTEATKAVVQVSKELKSIRTKLSAKEAEIEALLKQLQTVSILLQNDKKNQAIEIMESTSSPQAKMALQLLISNAEQTDAEPNNRLNTPKAFRANG